MRCSTALLAIIITTIGSSPASACCLTDWLFGRTSSPYVAGYAPYGYAAGYVPASPYAAGYPAATTSVLRPSWGSAAPVLSNGPYLSQRPTYYDNPSVYTGLPVNSMYQAGRIPVASNYRGNAPATSSYLGAANQYPSTYVSGYGAAQVPVTGGPGMPLAVTTPAGAPTTALPATQVAPLYAPTVPQRRGLGRFFGSLLGTNYRSSYYRAPVTYYRPATTVDPISGTTVTVQQPCTSYAQQLQRTPYSSLQGPTVTPMPAAPGCSTPTYGSTITTPSAPPGFGTPVPSGIGQASATVPPSSGSFTVPIPSTAPTPSAGYYGQGEFAPNRAPLTGAPGSQPSTEDRSPVGQPEILNRPPSFDNGYRTQPAPNSSDTNESKPKSYWELQDADDSTAMIRKPAPTRYRAQPIAAPDDYESPFHRELESPAMPVNRRSLRDQLDFAAPPLPASSKSPVDRSHETNWISAPVREASTTNRRQYRPAVPKPIQRDTTWKPARTR